MRMNRIVGFLARYIYAVGSCFYLLSAGTFSTRHRRLIFDICKHFGYKFPDLVEPIIPEIDLSVVVPRSTSIEVCEPRQDDGNISLLEIMAINGLIAVHQPKTLFEIGTFDGRTTLNMAANSSPDARVYTLDLPKSEITRTKLALSDYDRPYINKDQSGWRFQGTELGKKIVQFAGDSATFDFAEFFDRIDFVFVDGSHRYDYVRNDSDVAFKLLRGGKGIILWHDYASSYEVTKAMNELYRAVPAMGLKRIQNTSLICLRRV